MIRNFKFFGFIFLITIDVLISGHISTNSTINGRSPAEEDVDLNNLYMKNQSEQDEPLGTRSNKQNSSKVILTTISQNKAVISTTRKSPIPSLVTRNHLKLYSSSRPKTYLFEGSTIHSRSSTISDNFSIFNRKLDFDPCFSDAIRGSCEVEPGKPALQIIRYSFKSQTGLCYQVKFTGCRSGENLFDNPNDCKSTCEFRLYSSLKSPKCQSPYTLKCIAPNDPNNNQTLRRYFPLSSSEDCEPFTSVDSPYCLSNYCVSRDQCRKLCLPNPPVEHMLQNRCFANVMISDLSCQEDQKVNLWFFDKKINQCLQYRTCPVDTNGNVFHSSGDCERACMVSTISGVCDLPQDDGSGHGIDRRYYYDSKMEKCQIFYYKGSLGNLNRFTTKTECKNACEKGTGNSSVAKLGFLTSNQNLVKYHNGTSSTKTWLNETIDREYCYDPHKFGECSSSSLPKFIKKYYYDAHRGKCELYIFSGCGTESRNSFETRSICDKLCTTRIAEKRSPMCSQKIYKCSENQRIHWAYNLERGVCEPFASCNKQVKYQSYFPTEEQCSRTCVATLPLKSDLFDVCHLPPTIVANCTLPMKRWYYEHVIGSCTEMESCDDQYGNNFPSHSSCLSTCEPQDTKDVCQLPEDKGPCKDNNTIRYHFDWEKQSCRPFLYGGCLGNKNRFLSIFDCDQFCSHKNACSVNWSFVNVWTLLSACIATYMFKWL